MLQPHERHISYYIKEYLEFIRQNFYDYLNNTSADDLNTHDKQFLKEKFDSVLKIDVTSSKKYTKIITVDRYFTTKVVHSYILNKDDNLHDKNFKKGDILKLHRDYKHPDRDKIYGNVFLKNYSVTWLRPIDPLDTNNESW